MYNLITTIINILVLVLLYSNGSIGLEVLSMTFLLHLALKNTNYLNNTGTSKQSNSL
jgi:hypothetical protein